MDITDAELLGYVAAGSALALVVLFDRHAPVVYRTALSWSCDEEIAEAATLDAFLDLWADPATDTVPIDRLISSVQTYLEVERVLRAHEV